MAKINKLKKDVAGVSTTVYPVTVPQAVVDPADNKKLSTKLIEVDTSITGLNNGLVQLAGDVSVKAKNIVVNGNFASGTAGWASHNGATLSVIAGEMKIDAPTTTYAAAKTTIDVGAIGDKIYVCARYRHTSSTTEIINLQLGGTASTQVDQPNTDIVRKRIQTVAAGGNQTMYLGKYSQASAFSIYVKSIIAINLTKLFGAGNEPTMTEMDTLLSLFQNNYFEGEKTITQQLMNWELKMIRQNRAAIIALGGTII